jgi:hypothetical protein
VLAVYDNVKVPIVPEMDISCQYKWHFVWISNDHAKPINAFSHTNSVGSYT